MEVVHVAHFEKAELLTEAGGISRLGVDDRRILEDFPQNLRGGFCALSGLHKLAADKGGQLFCRERRRADESDVLVPADETFIQKGLPESSLSVPHLFGKRIAVGFRGIDLLFYENPIIQAVVCRERLGIDMIDVIKVFFLQVFQPDHFSGVHAPPHLGVVQIEFIPAQRVFRRFFQRLAPLAAVFAARFIELHELLLPALRALFHRVAAAGHFDENAFRVGTGDFPQFFHHGKGLPEGAAHRWRNAHLFQNFIRQRPVLDFFFIFSADLLSVTEAVGEELHEIQPFRAHRFDDGLHGAGFFVHRGKPGEKFRREAAPSAVSELCQLPQLGALSAAAAGLL